MKKEKRKSKKKDGVPKRNKYREDGIRSKEIHRETGILMNRLAPDYIGESHPISEGVWHSPRTDMCKKDTPLGRSSTPIDEDLRTGYASYFKFYRYGDALRGESCEIIVYMARFSKFKSTRFAATCPRTGDLTPEQAPGGLAPFPEDIVYNKELARQIVKNYKKWVAGAYVLIHIVGPSLDKPQWISVVRVINVPDDCFIPYSKIGSKRNRIDIVIPGLGYTYIGDGRPYIVNTLNGPREEPRTSKFVLRKTIIALILEALKPPKGFVKHNGLYVVSQGHGYDTSPKDKESFRYE
ncbi:MAG: hypothetical protein WC346_18200, partial [Methanogenium sp.]